jgi:hypothetical protein
MSKPRMCGRYQMEGLEDQEVMKREEEVNFPHIKTNTDYNCKWCWPISLVNECELKSTRCICNISPFPLIYNNLLNIHYIFQL